MAVFGCKMMMMTWLVSCPTATNMFIECSFIFFLMLQCLVLASCHHVAAIKRSLSCHCIYIFFFWCRDHLCLNVCEKTYIHYSLRRVFFTPNIGTLVAMYCMQICSFLLYVSLLYRSLLLRLNFFCCFFEFCGVVGFCFHNHWAS